VRAPPFLSYRVGVGPATPSMPGATGGVQPRPLLLPQFPSAPLPPQISWVRVTACDDALVVVPGFQGAGLSTKLACPSTEPGPHGEPARPMSVLSAFCHCAGLKPPPIENAGSWAAPYGFGGGVMLLDEKGVFCEPNADRRCVAAECRVDARKVAGTNLDMCACASLTLYCTDEA
jgi:hypothetical protein